MPVLSPRRGAAGDITYSSTQLIRYFLVSRFLGPRRVPAQSDTFDLARVALILQDATNHVGADARAPLLNVRDAERCVHSLDRGLYGGSFLASRRGGLTDSSLEFLARVPQRVKQVVDVRPGIVFLLFRNPSDIRACTPSDRACCSQEFRRAVRSDLPS